MGVVYVRVYVCFGKEAGGGGSELKGAKEMNEIRSHTALPTNSICGCVSAYVIGL